jgi:antitoxin component YwqK of YwqJK toxin-antitoxin module
LATINYDPVKFMEKKLLRIILLILLSSSILGQETNTIFYRGKEVLLYPADSITTLWERISLIKHMPDGKYYGFLQGDTSDLRLSISYLNNEINGEVIEYYSDPPTPLYLTTYNNGIKNGHWIEYSDDTILHEGNYLNGKEDGYAYSYTGSKGQKIEYFKGFYRNDTLIYKIWFKDDSTYFVGDTGYIYESNYTGKVLGLGKEFGGYKVGLWTYFYPNGQTKSSGNYLIIKHSDSFSESRKNGKWIDYYENGQIDREYLCESKWPLNNNLVSVISQYDSSGNLLDPGKLKDGYGTYLEFYPNGFIYTKAKYSNLYNPDYEKVYYENRVLRYIRKFKRNKRLITKLYYPNGKKEMIERTNYVVDSSLDFPAPPLPGKVRRFDETGRKLKN